MNILVASSEVVPFAKTGGLADVCGALPIELSRLGHHVQVFMPAFRTIHEAGQPIEETGISFDIPVGTKVVRGSLLKSKLPNSDVDVFFVNRPEYFDRAGIYRDESSDFNDNCERFVFFCRAVMESIRELDLAVDVIHCNDWPTGLIPALQDIEYAHVPKYERIATVLTIHNLAYQGSFWHWDMLLTGLDWKYFNWHQMECYNQLNLLKTGIVFADAITTVSPKYASEIQTSEHGCGLEGVLADRRENLTGIINGVDYSIWSPEHDSLIETTFTAQAWKKGKSACKKALQARLGLPQKPKVPVFGLVGRLAEQKGWDLVIEVMKSWVPRVEAQWVILGTGEDRFHEELQELAEAHPARVSAQLTFSNELAHQIEAGSDMFLMPSRFEPCGLNQLYSLKYGTIPVVHRVGGLADTITDANSDTLVQGTATGFCFDEYTETALQEAIRKAYDLYVKSPEAWESLVETAMNQDWSWEKSASQYIDLYQAIHRQKAESQIKHG